MGEIKLFSKRQKKVLLYLLKSKKPVTARWISKELAVSDRTIRNDIKHIQEESYSFGVEVKLIRGKGYQVKVINQELFHQIYGDLTKDEADQSNVDFSEQNNRVIHLLKSFLLDNGYIKLEVFEDAMFVSKSTIQNDLKLVREILSKYKLELVNRPHYGLYIEGDEYMKRQCLSNYIYDRDNELESNLEELQLFDGKVYSKILKVIVEKVNKYKIEISDISLKNLATHITIACKRIENGFSIEQSVGQVIDDYPFEKIVGKEIVTEVEAFTGLKFSESEINYIVIHLVGTKLIHKEDLLEYSKFDEVESIIQCMLNTLQNKMHWDFHKDHEFIQALTLHIRPAMNRLRYKMNIRNPLLKEIKVKYPTAFEGAVIASKCIKEYLSIEVGEHEIAYIALHIGVALERMKSKNKEVKRVLLVCASGVGSAKLLYYRLENLFEQELEIVATINYYRLEAFDLSSIDFIISTVPIKDDIGVPVHLVNTFLEEEDIIGIKNRLYSTRLLEEGSSYLDPARVFIKKEFGTKDNVIHFLCDELYKNGLVPEDYERLVIERETVAPTSFGNLVAIPHPSTPVTKETFWTVCTLKRPISWSNGQMVQFVCLLNISVNKKGELDKMYRKLISVMEDRESVQRIINSDSVEEIINILN